MSEPELICIGCQLSPDQISSCKTFAAEFNVTPIEYVREHEGTLNRDNGHFLCDACYVDAGMPALGWPSRWVAP
jgi:hypothetical protein